MIPPRYIPFGSLDAEQLPPQLELYHTDILRLFTNGLSFADNMQCDIVTAQFNSDLAPIRVALRTLKSPPLAVWVLRAQERGQDTIMSGNRITWTSGGQAITIVDVDGLTPSTTYSVTLLAVGG